MTTDVVLREDLDDCAVLRLNRPERLNTITTGMLGALEAELDRAAQDGSRALILTGTGRAFCAGTDLSAVEGDPQQRLLRVHALLRRLLDFPKTSIAAVNGLALGGGLEFALGCTFRVARRSASMGLPEIRLGLLPAYGGTQLLPRLVGAGAALEMMLSGDPVDGARALEIGLANRLCEDAEDVVAAAAAFARAFTRHSLVPQRAIRRAVARGLELELDAGLALERALVGEVSQSADTLEGVDAFLSKRAPVWKDR
jgi:enoyl-CoA hydratase/carnithine racemase